MDAFQQKLLDLLSGKTTDSSSSSTASASGLDLRGILMGALGGMPNGSSIDVTG